jgi:hypothetical protein
MNTDKTPKGTTWKRRRVAAIAGLALSALTAIGAASLTGNAQAGTGWGGLRTPQNQTSVVGVPRSPAPVTSPTSNPTPNPTTNATSGWGG